VQCVITLPECKKMFNLWDLYTTFSHANCRGWRMFDNSNACSPLCRKIKPPDQYSDTKTFKHQHWQGVLALIP
jgi:hypothetical protein